MTKLLRFRDLKERGVANSWTMLKLRIERDGFPPGRMIGPNSRAWSEEEVDDWYTSRPIAGPGTPRGAAKKNRDRARSKAVDSTTSTAA